MKASLLLIAPIALATSLADAQSVRIGADCVPQVSQLESRLYQKATDGPEALRNFLFIRRGIYALDIAETSAWARYVSSARSACEKATGAATETPSGAAKVTLPANQ